MDIVQYTWPRSGYNYGIKQYTNGLAQQIPVRTVAMNQPTGRRIAPELILKYYRHHGDVNHFTDQWLSFIGIINPEHSVLSVMDVITENYYDGYMTGTQYYDRFDAITTLSECARKDIIDRYDVENVIVVPCGVNPNEYYQTNV